MTIALGLLTAAAMMINITEAPYYAIPNDGLDDGPVIRQAIEDIKNTVPYVGEEIYFPPGVYDVAPAILPVSVPPANQIYGVLVDDASNITFRGDGAASIIRKINSSLAFIDSSYFLLFDVRNSDGVRFSNLKLDGNRHNLVLPTQTPEQFHLIHLDKSTVFVDNVAFIDAEGDGIKAAGQDLPTARFSSLSVSRSTFSGMKRNGITCNTGCREVSVHESRFSNIIDTGIDFEPDQGAAKAIVTNNFFDMPASGTGLAAVFSGRDVELMSELIFSNNVVTGRIQGGSLHRALLSNNSVMTEDDTATGKACFKFFGTVEEVSFLNNTIDCKNSPALETYTQVGRMPYSISFNNNVVRARVGWKHDVGGPGQLSAVSNQIIAPGPGSTGISLKAGSVPLEGLLVSNNQLTGFDTGVLIAASNSDVNDVLINDNVIRNGTTGIKFLKDCPSQFDNVLYEDNIFGGLSNDTQDSALAACPP